MDLSGKTAVITGASGAMGSLLARALKKEGANLILVERDLTLIEHLEDLLDGPQSAKYECDLSDKDKIGELVAEIGENFRKVDILYNVAGIGIYKNIDELTEEEWLDSININLNAPFFLIKRLRKLGLGLVVNFGSGMGTIPAPGRSAYCSSKFGLRGLSLSLAKELKDVSVVLMTLGSVWTDFGTGGLEERKKLREKGKEYLNPEDVIKKVIQISKDDERKAEYVMYPEGYEGSY